jgi:hypothetical protein
MNLQLFVHHKIDETLLPLSIHLENINTVTVCILNEWLLLMWSQQFVSYIMAWTSSFWWDDDDICFALDQPDYLNFYIACSLKQESAVRLCVFTQTHYTNSQPTNLWFLIITDMCLANKQQMLLLLSFIWSLTEDKTHNIPHSRQARKLLHHRFNRLDSILYDWLD